MRAVVKEHDNKLLASQNPPRAGVSLRDFTSTLKYAKRAKENHGWRIKGYQENDI